jgi:hypothetical protein
MLNVSAPSTRDLAVIWIFINIILSSLSSTVLGVVDSVFPGHSAPALIGYTLILVLLNGLFVWRARGALAKLSFASAIVVLTLLAVMIGSINVIRISMNAPTLVSYLMNLL